MKLIEENRIGTKTALEVKFGRETFPADATLEDLIEIFGRANRGYVVQLLSPPLEQFIGKV